MPGLDVGVLQRGGCFDESGLDTEFGQTAGEGLATNSGPLSERIRVGSVLSGFGVYFSVRFLTRYLANRSLRPFAAYCLIVGVVILVLFAIR